MNEKNIILIAALGFGAFFLLTRKASAAAVRPYQPGSGAQTQATAPSTKNTLLTGLLGIAGGLISQSRAQAAPSAQQSLADFAWAGFGGDFSAVNTPYTSPTMSSAAQGVDYGNLGNPFDPQWGTY